MQSVAHRARSRVTAIAVPNPKKRIGERAAQPRAQGLQPLRVLRDRPGIDQIAEFPAYRGQRGDDDDEHCGPFRL